MTTTTATDLAPLVHADTEPLVEDGYTGGPEANLGNDISRRGTFQLSPTRFLSITVTGYVNGHILSGEGRYIRDAEHSDLKLPLWDETDEHTAAEYLRPYEMAQVEYFIYDSTDGHDGTTKAEVHCDYETITEVGYLWPRTIARAEDSLIGYVKSYNFERDFSVSTIAKGFTN